MAPPVFSEARILVVDDEPANVLLLTRLLQRWGYENVVSTTDSAQAISLAAGEPVSLVLLDLAMPRPDGFEVMALLAKLPAGHAIPIVVLTADVSAATRQRALSGGASDFVTKPFDETEVRLRVQNLLRTRSLQLELEHHNALLEQRVRERTHDLEYARRETLNRLALAGEYRDDEVDLIRRSAPLHDIGKVGVPDAILLKRGRLTADEFDLIKGHTLIGGRILAHSVSEVLQAGEVIARTHHERWDGGGYPVGLSGEAIPLHGRLVALADMFDALTHERPYKPAWPLDRAAAEIRRVAGQQLDPALVHSFERLDHGTLLASTGFADRVAGGHR
jgi:putative two-component system response regulator